MLWPAPMPDQDQYSLLYADVNLDRRQTAKGTRKGYRPQTARPSTRTHSAAYRGGRAIRNSRLASGRIARGALRQPQIASGTTRTALPAIDSNERRAAHAGRSTRSAPRYSPAGR